ncbi:MAG: TAXI family TRAP transporter solute-binding subunit [Gemmobacter sp.]
MHLWFHRTAAACAMLALLCSPVRALTFLSVGSGELDGGYYRVVRAICDAANAAFRSELRCSAEPTPGSIYNLIALSQGDLDLALVQSDWLVHARRGTSVFARHGPDARLRTVLPLYPEAVTLIVRRDAAIAGFGEIAGRRVDLGHPASGRRATMERLMEEYGLKSQDLGATCELQPAAALSALCAGAIDALVLVAGHPNARLGEVLDRCDAVIVPIVGPEAERLLAADEGFVPVVLEAYLYPAQPEAVETIAVRATLVARDTMPDEPVRRIVEVIATQAARLGEREALLKGLDPARLARDAPVAPLHPAAASVLGLTP